MLLRSLRPVEWLLLFLVLITSPLFFIGGPDWLSPPLYRACWNLGHIAFFAVSLHLVCRLWPVRSWLAALLWLLLVFVGGMLIEWLQTKVGREASWLDVGNNLLGAGLGLFWSMTARPWVWLARAALTMLLAWPLISVARIALVQWESAQQFPLLAGFEQERELIRWDGLVERVEQAATQGNYALQMTFGTRRYSGVSLNWFLGDWRGYKALSFDVFNPHDDNLPLMIRIHDLAHDLGDMAYDDRFNRHLVIAPGANRIRIDLAEVQKAPESRQMALHQLRAIGFFTVQLPQPRQIYLDNLRLEVADENPQQTSP